MAGSAKESDGYSLQAAAVSLVRGLGFRNDRYSRRSDNPFSFGAVCNPRCVTSLCLWTSSLWRRRGALGRGNPCHHDDLSEPGAERAGGHDALLFRHTEPGAVLFTLSWVSHRPILVLCLLRCVRHRHFG